MNCFIGLSRGSHWYFVMYASDEVLFEDLVKFGALPDDHHSLHSMSRDEENSARIFDLYILTRISFSLAYYHAFELEDAESGVIRY